MPNRYTLEDFQPYIVRSAGRPNPLPNVKQVSAERFADALASFGHSLTPQWGYCEIEGRKAWTFLFMDIPNGTGYGTTYSNKTYTFALCEHEKVLRPTDRPNHERGWHPGVCKLCGLNMDVDSGD